VMAVLTSLGAPLAQTDTQPLVRWSWITDNLDEIGSRAVQHVWLTLVSVAVALVIAVPFAILASRRRWVIGPVSWISSILYTVPALAVIALLIPITGLSLTTVAIPLISYNLLILFRNTLAGLDSVDPDVEEAARGMGFTARQLLWKVEVPLAMPVIIAGVRIATVSSIGLVTIAALIGRGGFGQFILKGLNEFFWTPLVVGVVLSVAFALLADLSLLGLQRWATPWSAAAGTRAVGT
jgi:osmoprotectant transport system permease protein